MLAACAEPGASVSAVALWFGLNANLVHQWRRGRGYKEWLQLERARVADGGATAKAIDYSLNNWTALTRNLHDGEVPVSNNHIENLVRPWAVGRKAWLFCGSELAGQRAAMVMSLVQSAKLCGHDPHAYLRDVLQRLRCLSIGGEDSIGVPGSVRDVRRPFGLRSVQSILADLDEE